MEITRATVLKLLSGLIISFSLFVMSGKTLTSSIELTVDVNQVVSDVSNNPIGISLNFIPVDPKISQPLKNLNLGSLRFPEGELGDRYLFDKNNPTAPKISIKDPSMGFSKLFKPDGTWYSKLSFDDYISISQSIKAEPFIIVGIDALVYTGNAPHATSEEVIKAAVDWVEYANIINNYNVKYWEIGNENNLKKSHLNWTPQKYAETVIQFSRAMKAVDPSIKIGANGMGTNKDDWWNHIMPTIKNDVDFLITHQYSWMKNYQQWKDNVWDFTYNIDDAIEAINTYNPSLRLNVTEISSHKPGAVHGNNTWKMLHNFEVLGGAFLYDQIDYIHFWTSRWLTKDAYSKDNSAFNFDYKLMPMGYPLKVWGNFLKKKMVFASQSGTIRSWASYDPEDRSLNVFLLNKDELSQNISVTLNNYTGNMQNERWVLKGSTPQSIDVTWEQSGSVTVQDSKIQTKLDPLSVTVISFQSS